MNPADYKRSLSLSGIAEAARKEINELLEAKISEVWYHGDPTKRRNFKGQKLDRDRFEDANQHGPGVYLTNNKKQSLFYTGAGASNGYVYTVEVGTKKILTTRNKPTLAKAIKFIQLLSYENREIGLTNWGYESNDQQGVRAVAQQYVNSNNDAHTMFIVLGNDFTVGHSPDEWAEVMITLGYDGYMHDYKTHKHMVVWNTSVLTILKEEPASAVIKELDLH